MRAICNPCPHKDTCSYLKQGKERDCITVQDSDYGYEEATAKAIELFGNYLAEFGCDDYDKRLNDFKQALEL